MGADLISAIVPVVDLDEQLKSEWDKICDELQEEDVYCDSVDTSDPDWKETIKDWKNTYTDYCKNYRRDVTNREINGISYLISGHMSWGGDTPDGLNFLSNLDNVYKLSSWLSKEAQKQAIKKLIPVVPSDDISSAAIYANGYFDSLAECGITHLEVFHLKRIYKCIYDDLDLCIHAPKISKISEAAARILNKTNWKFRLSYNEPNLEANKLEVLNPDLVEMAIDKYASGEANEIDVSGYYFATKKALDMLAKKQSRVNLRIGYCKYTLSEEDRFVIFKNPEEVGILEEKCPDAEDGDELITINKLPIDTNRIKEIGSVAYFTELYSMSDRLNFVFRKEVGDEYRLEFCEEDLEIASINNDIVINNENSETLSIIANRECTTKYGDKLTLPLEQPNLTELTPDITDIISGHNNIYLDGLNELTLEQATALSKSAGTLSLNGLNKISAPLAEILATNHELLLLNGITSLSIDCAESLSKHKGDLELRGLTNLNDKVAYWLSNHEGPLALDGLNEISKTVAESLAKAEKIEYISLEGLTQISDEIAQILAGFRGGLFLGLTNLSDSVAKSFSKHEGPFFPGKISELSDFSAEQLSKHKGEVGLHDCHGLTKYARELLLKNTEIYLPE